MSDGMMFAALAALVGKKHGARWGKQRVTIGAVGWNNGERFVMAHDADGTVILGAPSDFTIPQPKPKRAMRGDDPVRDHQRRQP